MSASDIDTYFGDLPDPRDGANISHPLINIITITLCAVICGADNWVDVAMFGEAKQAWFSQFLDLRHGIPSHDTLGRFFRHLEPEAFEVRFREWASHICERIEGEVVAVDGKQLRRSKDGTLGKAGIYMVNVWATENGLSLAQHKVEHHTNEITAIPELLRLLDIEGQVITIDAIGCQTEVVEAITAQKANYVIAAKANQGTLRADIEAAFETKTAQQAADSHRTVGKDHGRVEIRECWATDAPDIIAYINEYKTWQGLQSIVKLHSERRFSQTGQVEQNTRYFISSLPADAEQLLATIRAHWQVENSLHWVLDVAFREDESRVRKDHGPQNLAAMRQFALNLLKCETTLKVGISAKRKRAGWDETYLAQVLRSI